MSTTVASTSPQVPLVAEPSRVNGSIPFQRPQFNMNISVEGSIPRRGATGGWATPPPPLPTQYTEPIGPPAIATQDSNRLEDVHPTLRNAFEGTKAEFERQLPQYAVVVTSSARSREKQQQIFNMSKGVYTTVDGASQLSRHNYSPALAVDATIINRRSGTQIDPNTPLGKQLYKKLGETAELSGLVWGGRWKTPYDPYHFQLEQPAPLSPDRPGDAAVAEYVRRSRGALN